MYTETIKLDSVITDIAAGPFGSNLKVSCFVEYGFPIIDGANLKGFKVTDNIKKYVTEEKARSLHRSIAHRNDVVVTISGTLGQIAYIPFDSKFEEYLCSQRQFRVTFNTDRVHVPYLVYYFHSREGQHKILSFANQTGVPALSQPLKNFRNIEVNLPDINTQKRIASVLKSLDNKIELNTKINENLEQQAQAILKSWFVDFEPFGGKMPDNWNECILDSICSLIIKGITPKYVDQSDQLVINQKCVRNHQVDLSLARCHEPKKVNEKWLQYGDIVVNSTGTGTLGRVAQVLLIPNNLTVDSHVTIIRASKKEYLYYLGLWATSHEHDFEMLQTGSTGQTDLPRERLKQMPIILPSKDILCKFSEVIKPIADIKIKNQQENQHLTVLRNTLLPKLMNGEIDVSKVQI